ncbi:MAG TPA: ABC transporter substrate-binding protein [Candidatus Kapabacteria bacterium]|nr:ABC transporter substrate-binding protein [Candidatus Kapabacteria bacterium]
MGENRVVKHILSDLEGLNPFNSSGADETYTEEAVFERLIRIDPKTMQYTIPWLADSLPIESADHMQFDFRLRKGIKFADGIEMTGNDVIFSLKALKNPLNTQSAQKRVYVDYIHSAELIDGDPYRIRFKMWKAYYLTKQAAFGDVLYILPKHIFDPKGLTDKYSWDDIASIVEKNAASDIDSAKLATMQVNPAMRGYADWFTQPERNRDPKFIIGSGPYKLKQWATNDHITLERNTFYTNKGGSQYGAAYPDQLIYKIISDWSAAITALKARDIDVMGFIQPPYYVKIDTTQMKYLSKTTFPLPAYSLIGWNLDRPYFRDAKVRLALAHLIDRQTILNKVLFGLGRLSQSPVFFGKPEYNPNLPLISFNPDTAKLLLKEAGWEDHDGDGILDKVVDGKSVPFSFTFLVNVGNETRKQILLIITEAMRKVGIKAEVQAIEWSVFLNRLRDHEFDARYGSWQSDPFENDSYQLYHSSQALNRGSNYDGWKSARADHLLDAIRSELDDQKRYALQKEFQQVLYEEQPEAIMWVPENPTGWVNRFDGVEFNAYRPGYDIALWKVKGSGSSVKQTAELY